MTTEDPATKPEFPPAVMYRISARLKTGDVLDKSYSNLTRYSELQNEMLVMSSMSEVVRTILVQVHWSRLNGETEYEIGVIPPYQNS